MKKIILGLVVGTAFSLGTVSAYGVLDLRAALKSGGLVTDTSNNSAQPVVLQNANYQLQPASSL